MESTEPECRELLHPILLMAFYGIDTFGLKGTNSNGDADSTATLTGNRILLMGGLEF